MTLGAGKRRVEASIAAPFLTRTDSSERSLLGSAETTVPVGLPPANNCGTASL